MSCCYNAAMGIKFKSEADKALAAEELRKFLQDGKDASGREFEPNLAEFAKQGITVDTIEGCIDVVLAGWDGQRVIHGIYKKDADGLYRNELVPTDDAGYFVYSNGFNARYGWISIMEEFFERLAKYLADGSYFNIDFDNDYVEYEVNDGTSEEINRGSRDDEEEESNG